MNVCVSITSVIYVCVYHNTIFEISEFFSCHVAYILTIKRSPMFVFNLILDHSYFNHLILFIVMLGYVVTFINN